MNVRNGRFRTFTNVSFRPEADVQTNHLIPRSARLLENYWESMGLFIALLQELPSHPSNRLCRNLR